MKRIFLSIVLAVVALFCACAKPAANPADENTVVIVPSEEVLALDGATLADYLAAMKERGLISYTMENGMLTEVNGKKNRSTGTSSAECWMIYTSDPDYSNAAFGTLTYDGVVYPSASLGAESIVLSKSFVYLLAYHTVTW